MEIEGMPNQLLTQFETYTMRETTFLIVLMIFCYICRQEPSITVIREALPSN